MRNPYADKLTFRGRPLLDVVILVAGAFAAIALAGLIPGLQRHIAISAWVIPVAITLVSWLILRWRGQGFRDIGVRKPENLGKTIVIGLAVALALFLLATATEAMGYVRNLSRFDFLKDNLPLALMGLLYGFFGAGLYEEVVFRGFLGNRFANMLGDGKRAWIVAIVLQALIFALGHASQGVYGMFYAGAAGLMFGFVYLKCGRNLWPVIIGHGGYDSARFIYIYCVLTYGGG